MGRIKNLIRNLNYLSKHSLWDQREQDIVYFTSKILDDGLYEYGIDTTKKTKLKVLSYDQSMETLIREPKSFVRTGDGEINLINGIDQPFQKYEEEIANRLRDLLGNPKDDIYVGINKLYYSELKDDYHRRWAYEFRKENDRLCNQEIVYFDAGMTNGKFNNINRNVTEKAFEQWKCLFDKKKLLIVCGEGILDKLEYDIFEYAEEKQYVYGPRISAWDAHERIVKEVETYSKDYLVVFILGMAGKAMIPELTEKGYMCWDIGHLAKYYDAYRHDVKWTPEFAKKFYAPD